MSSTTALPTMPPRAGEPRARAGRGLAQPAFTLVELLVVVAILSLLVTLVAPTLGRVKEAARKALCATQLHAYGVASALYIGQYGHYAPMGTSSSYGGWPKMHGILQMMSIQGIAMSDGDLGGQFDNQWARLWDKAICPGMDLEAMWDHIERGIATQTRIMMKPGRYPLGLAYQWNTCLRAPGSPIAWFPTGRWPAAAYNPDGEFDNWPSWDNTWQLDYVIRLPIDETKVYIAQAVHSREVRDPGMCAEAWDGIDPPCVQGVTFNTWDLEKLAPGWHAGPQMWGASGWALLNGIRHARSPNILYADGSVRADATRRISVPGDVKHWPSGTLPNLVFNSWPDYDPTFGTVWHVLPQKKITTVRP